MKALKLFPAQLAGTVAAPPSKSVMHRALILTRLSGGRVLTPFDSEDIAATRECMEALYRPNPIFNCRESASTLRFMIPLSLALSGGGIFLRAQSLSSRPLETYRELFPYAELTQGEALKISGMLKPQCYTLRGDVSSQFITGLLLALPLIKGESRIHVIPPFESMGYVDITLKILADFGINVHRPSAFDFIIPGGQRPIKRDYAIEGDYSQASVFLAAAALSHPVCVSGLDPHSLQGDQAILSILTRMGCKLTFADTLTITPPPRLAAVDVDGMQCPDIIPLVALLLSLSDGEAAVRHCGRLRLKECDRLAATVSSLRRMGADILQAADAMVIRGVPRLKGGVALSCHHDHRMAMMLSIAALNAHAPVTLIGPGCVSKSWPGFFETYFALGGVGQ